MSYSETADADGLARSTGTERCLDELLRFGLCAVGIVARRGGLLVFLDGTIVVSSRVEDLSEVDVRPHFYPLRLEVACGRIAEVLCRRRDIAEFKLRFTHAEMVTVLVFWLRFGMLTDWLVPFNDSPPPLMPVVHAGEFEQR